MGEREREKKRKREMSVSPYLTLLSSDPRPTHTPSFSLILAHSLLFSMSFSHSLSSPPIASPSLSLLFPSIPSFSLSLPHSPCPSLSFPVTPLSHRRNVPDVLHLDNDDGRSPGDRSSVGLIHATRWSAVIRYHIILFRSFIFYFILFFF